VLAGISIVATDLDGTLLASDGQISERTRLALERAAQAGITVIVVTARPYWALRDLKLRDVHALVVCVNGALIVDLESDAVVSSAVLHDIDVQVIAERLRALAPGIAFAVETTTHYGHEPHYANKWPMPSGSPIDSLDRLAPDGVLKLLGRHSDVTVARLLEIAEFVGPSASVTFSEGDGLVELGPAGVSKGSGLSEVVSLLGRTSDDVVAIGDMPNDLPMLAWARVAAAVANAHPDVIDAADMVVARNDDNGVAHLIDLVIAANTSSRSNGSRSRQG
jgi:Cof subfamily protein (haloacid dehalogenase superfamily)